MRVNLSDPQRVRTPVRLGAPYLPRDIAASHPGTLDAKIHVDPGRLVTAFGAEGDQYYIVERVDGQLVWSHMGPRANLFDDAGVLAGRHWNAKPGFPAWRVGHSQLSAQKDASLPSARPVIDLPWLRLRTATAGTGVLAGVTLIQRIHTRGGQPPVGRSFDEPDVKLRESDLGARVIVPYTADYFFFR